MKNLLVLCFLLLQLSLSSQEINQSYISPGPDTMLQAKQFMFHFSNNNFLKNNEYFNPYTEGLTFFGSNLQPEITYAFTSNTRLSAGFYARYFYGKEKFNSLLPVIRFEYEPWKGSRLIFGQLYGLLDHKLLEPIYSSDNYFMRNPEYGVQFMHEREYGNASVWISWDRFILPGDNQKEEISAGFNSSFRLLKNADRKKLDLQFQGVIHHFGGQVDTSDEPLETRLNLAGGLVFASPLPQLSGLQVEAAAFAIQSADQSSKTTIPYKKGYALYSYAQLKYNWARLMLSYFHGKYFFSPLGEPLFESVSSLNILYYRDNRSIFGQKLLLDHRIAEGIDLGFRFESYYDLERSSIDFCYGLNIKTSASWVLGKIARNKQ
ncbi:MAG: hypothetical protein IPH88_16530 [Bacteroidales bacterium]|nr:hypothetical protein [Bacteroidales bacterium]